jgi:hypothetical protein
VTGDPVPPAVVEAVDVMHVILLDLTIDQKFLALEILER